jgi:hypothetical protein
LTRPLEHRTRIIQLYPVLRLISRCIWECKTTASRGSSKRGWKKRSPPVIEATKPTPTQHTFTGNGQEIIPMDPMSTDLLIPRNMLMPMPSSAHSSPMSIQNLLRGINNLYSLSVPASLASSGVLRAPGPTVGIVHWKTTTCPP